VCQLIFPAPQLREAGHYEQAAQGEAQCKLGRGEDDDGEEEHEGQAKENHTRSQKTDEVDKLLRAWNAACCTDCFEYDHPHTCVHMCKR